MYTIMYDLATSILHVNVFVASRLKMLVKCICSFYLGYKLDVQDA